MFGVLTLKGAGFTDLIRESKEDDQVVLEPTGPLLTDSDRSDSTIDCVLCHYNEDSTDDDRLFWYEYHPTIHNPRSPRLCDHCLFPPPKEMDFVLCHKQKHVYCLYCVELKLFRIQLGRFVSEPDDVGVTRNVDLGMQWEMDYVQYRRTKSGDKRSRTFSMVEEDNVCSCLTCWKCKKGDTIRGFLSKDSGDGRQSTQRMAGYKSAKSGLSQDMIALSIAQEDEQLQQQQKKHENEEKRNSAKTRLMNKMRKLKSTDNVNIDDNDSTQLHMDSFVNNGAINESVTNLVDEVQLDEMYGDDFQVNDDQTVMYGGNIKKHKAVEMLVKSCEHGRRAPPSVIIELNYDKYAVYCFSYVMSKLELKQRPYLFTVLEFIAMVSPTTIIIQLIIQYKKNFLMLPYKSIDTIFLAVIRGSKYSIATSLKMASIANEFATIDLSAKDTFYNLQEKYEAIAVDLIKQIESHHLAAILLETPSDIEKFTPLELAFENKLFTFLSQSKIEKIAHQVWIDSGFLNPKRNFEVNDIDAWAMLEYMKNPYKFYFQPYGKYVVETFLFVSYLLMFSYILTERPSIYDLPEPIEMLFWVFNAGYIAFEVHEALIESGLKNYLAGWTNYIDMSISINFATQIALRVIWIFSFSDVCTRERTAPMNYNSGLDMHDYQNCPTTAQISSTNGYWGSAGCNETFADWDIPSKNDDILCNFNSSDAFYYGFTVKCDCWRQLDHYLNNACCRSADTMEAILFNFLYGFNAILLWLRLLYFAEQNSTLGPLIKILGAMKTDFINYLQLTILFCIGFSFAMRAFIGDYSSEFDTVASTILYMSKSTFGKIDFSVLEACGDAVDDLCGNQGWVSFWRSNLVQVLMMVYLVISLIMIRLLIAMITYRYNQMIRKTEQQVVYQSIKNAYELDSSSGLIPPPLNIVVFAVAFIWIIMDLLMVVLINRYIDVENHLQLAKPIGSSYVKRVWNGVQDLFSRTSRYWICAYCRHHNYDVYDIKRYLEQFRPACDPADTKIVEVYQPVMCEQCYRNKSEVGRMTMVLQQISFCVFVIIVYPILFAVVLIPALLSWFGDYLGEGDEAEENWADDDEDEAPKMKRHITMNFDKNALNKRSSKYKNTHEYREKKKAEAEKKQRKEMINRAQKYRVMRQCRQLDTQMAAVPVSDSTHTTQNVLKKNLKQIIKSFNPHKTKYLSNPNINDIVDEVTSDKTPIAMLQKQVNSLQTTMTELYELVQAGQQFNVVTTLNNIENQQRAMDASFLLDDLDDDDDFKSGGGGVGPISTNLTSRKSRGAAFNPHDRTLAMVNQAAQKLTLTLNQTSHKGKSSGGGNRMSIKGNSVHGNIVMKKPELNDHHSIQASVADLADAMMEDFASGGSAGSPTGRKKKGKYEFDIKPSDALRHRKKYKQKSKANLNLEELNAGSSSESNTPVVGSTISSDNLTIKERKNTLGSASDEFFSNVLDPLEASQKEKK